MNQTRSVSYEINTVPEFIVEQLTGGMLSSFFPVSFVCEQSHYTGVYRTGECKALDRIEELSIKDMLWIFCQLLRLIGENEKHYFFGESYQIDVHTVYADLMRGQVRMIFQPMEEPCDTKTQLYRLLEDCKVKVSEEGQGYLQDMMEYLMKEEVGYRSAIHHGEQLQYEIYTCNIQ